MGSRHSRQDKLFLILSRLCRPLSAIRSGLATPRMCISLATTRPESCVGGRSGETKTKNIRFATWNVRTLVNADGSVETAARRGRVSEDRKINLVVREAERLGLEAIGLQETKWFGAASYSVGDALVISSGRPLPTGNFTRGEGVAVLLRRRARAAFERGGSQQSAVSSRLMTCKLKFPLCTGTQRQCPAERASVWVHLVVCYAPTFRASRSVKDAFYTDLQQTVMAVPLSDHLIVLGDFNARVGSAVEPQSSGLWRDVHGGFGIGERNDAGMELLDFSLRNNLTICNTHFRKRMIHLATWRHPRSQRWHCIDYVLVRVSQMQYVVDTHVIRGAECSTDHNLLCMTYCLPGRIVPGRNQNQKRRNRRFAVQELLTVPGMTDERRELVECTRAEYGHCLSGGLENFDAGGLIEEQWSCIKKAITSSAKAAIGHERRSSPDWFVQSAATLEPILKARNDLYRKCRSGSRADLVAYREARGEARVAVRSAKESWLSKQADIVEAERFNTKSAWAAIRAIQRCFGGITPMKVQSIQDTDGIVCTSLEAISSRWYEHFSNVLNIRSLYDLDVFGTLEVRPIDEELAIPPSPEEVGRAIRAMANGKAAGASGILPELVKYGSSELHECLLALLLTVWSTGGVPQEWRNAQLVPIPKRGDLSLCDNWRGISLLEVVGKMAGRLIQNRLQSRAEHLLPESQCGFRPNRGCADAVFTVRQLVEKAYEHRTKIFCIFVDLRKAYDSVPRAALYRALSVLGIPPTLLKVIESFHDGMVAEVRVPGGVTDEIRVENGLRQGV